MDKSLQNCTDELQGTKAAIKMALRSPAGVTYIPASIHNEAMLSGAWTSIAQ